MRWLGLGLLVTLMVNTALADDADPQRGERLYQVCAGCHGFAAEGNELVSAPALARLEDWYLTRQIAYYQDGVRGGAEDDLNGRNMAAMVTALSAAEARDVVAYIGTLPRPAALEATDGDVARGRALYAACAACHGDRAEGLEAMGAPNLVHLAPAYQIAQLKKFKNRQRGVHPADHFGRQMAPMAGVLADDAALADVSAYIVSLAGEP